LNHFEVIDEDSGISVEFSHGGGGGRVLEADPGEDEEAGAILTRVASSSRRNSDKMPLCRGREPVPTTMQPWIAPSILSADFSRLGEEINTVLNAGADVIHFDVMDNHYVPNLTIGPLVLESLRKAGFNCFMDVHLMVKPVDRLIGDFLDAGANLISVHPESTQHLHRTLSLIRDGGAQAGIVFNPATPLHVLDEAIGLVDMILIMSVNPGFGGQGFIPESLDKLRRARKRIDNSGREIRLEVDGGIKTGNIAAAARAGADTFVAGSAIFGSDDYFATIAAMRAALAGVGSE